MGNVDKKTTVFANTLSQQTIGYFFSAGAKPAAQIADIVREAIQHLQQIGLTVSTVTPAYINT